MLRVSDTLALPLDLVTLSTVVYGARGAGKTTLGSVVAEEVYNNGLRFGAIDLKGDWWGLKSSADGNHAGIPVVIFGGDHQDLPLEPDAGGYVAETIASLEQPTILDLEHLSKTKQLKFLGTFFERLYDKNREPLLLMLDEAQRYAPQRPMSPEANLCLGAVEDLVKLGRKHGIGPMLFTQRGSGLNKEVSELCDMLVAFRTPGSLDQDRIKDWLGANAGREQASEIMGAISGLHTGTAIFASNHPALRITPQAVTVRPRITFDSSATPKIGQRRREPKILAEPEIAALREKMADAIERAKADDPKELRKEITRLKAELDRKPTEVVTVQEKVVEIPASFSDEELGMIENAGRVLTNAGEGIGSAMKLLADFGALMAERARAPKREPAKIIRIDQPRPKPVVKPAAPDNSVLDYTLSKAERAFLGILMQYPSGRSQAQLAILAGYSPKSGLVGQALANLRKLDAIEGKAALITITDRGREIVGDDYEPLPTGAELRQYWLDRNDLSKAAKNFLGQLFAVYPDSIPQEDLALEAGYSPKSGLVGQALADLRKRELITGSAAAITASEELFQ
jgi:hypothetical protein